MRRPSLSHRHPVHVTLRVRKGVYNLRSRRSFREIERALRSVQHDAVARVVHYAVLGNHIHLIVEADDRRKLWRCVQVFEIRVALWLNRMMQRRKGKVFADRYHAHILRTPREVHHALGYVLRNHERHYGRATNADAYSSAAAFEGWSAPLRLGWSPLDERPPPVTPATSWLLRAGWKRHGKLAPHLSH